jgi:hypothetical protein
MVSSPEKYPMVTYLEYAAKLLLFYVSLAIVISCHRAINSNGRLDGYDCCLALKERLINLEQQVI